MQCLIPPPLIGPQSLLTDMTVQRQGALDMDENVQQFTQATVRAVVIEEETETQEDQRDEDYLR